MRWDGMDRGGTDWAGMGWDGVGCCAVPLLLPLLLLLLLVRLTACHEEFGAQVDAVVARAAQLSRRLTRSRTAHTDIQTVHTRNRAVSRSVVASRTC